MTRGPVLGSALVHVGIFVALFVVRTHAPIIVPGPEVVQVALIDPGMQVPTVLKVPPPPREEPPPNVAPTEDEGVRIEKPKPRPKPAPAKEEPRPPEPRASVALPFAAVGQPGLRGEVSIDAADFAFTYYLMLVRNRIAQNWASPGVGQGLQAVVYFRIARDGTIMTPRVEQPSGVEFFDRAAVRAVMLSDPLPPLPLGWSGSDLGVHFGFEYTGP